MEEIASKAVDIQYLITHAPIALVCCMIIVISYKKDMKLMKMLEKYLKKTK